MDTLTALGDEILINANEPWLERREGNARGGGGWLRAVCLAVIVVAAALITAWAIANDRRYSHRTECSDQLKRLGRAMLKHNDDNGHFPAPGIARGGQQLLSWRVALLPYLGYHSLYARFHLDETWDSPHNRALLREMPREYACPGGPGRRSGRTGYLVLVGPKTEFGSVNTPFESTRGADIREFIDGSSNTALIFESDTLVPWTKPEDLVWAPGGPLPKLAGPHRGGTHVLFADGARRFLKPSIAPNILLGLLTINGGEVLSAG
jgi:prepilin-type processing-associated H-X9-DG protein